MEKIDLTNHKYGNLKVLKFHGYKYQRRAWLCRCKCSKELVVTGNDLRTNKVTSCKSPECRIFNLKPANNAVSTHRMSKTRLYSIWSGMKKRCNTNHPNYIDVTYCNYWKKFENFRDWAIKNGYKDNLSLDRIDYKGNYEPDNCRWITSKQQARNTKKNKIFEYSGKKQCLAAWAEEKNINTRTLYDRIRRGWTIQKALTTKARSGYEGPR